jgi:putative GTP pyrophosphokinase
LSAKRTTVSELIKDGAAFDFEAHRKTAVDQFSKKRELYEHFASAVRDILADALESRKLKVNDIQVRAKELKSFSKKAMSPNEQNPGEPKYKNPLSEITDLAGVRVITFFPRTVNEVGHLIQEEFEVIEKVDHTASAEREQRLGYQSLHYVVRLGSNRNKLSEYRKFDGLVAEIQVRTVLQHAWAEIEHDIRYKSPSTIPMAISRRFMTLAGLLEIADREFEAIQDADDSLRANARTLIEQGRLDEVEITPDAVRSYLNVRLGSDDRISDYTYEWTTKVLRSMGFQNLGQVDECIAGLDDDQLSRAALGSRSGQVLRFEVLLAASMGENYLQGHPWIAVDADWFRKIVENWWHGLKQSGYTIGSYQPKKGE